MKITIEYESSWRNSFLDGSNNESLPKNGRKYIASSSSLESKNNYIKRFVTKDTVIGILNRLVGEQRKLYQARQDVNYYFKDIEDALTNNDIVDKALISNEVAYLRNISSPDSKNSFIGMIKSNQPLLNSNYSPELFGVLFLDLEQILDFILMPDYKVSCFVNIQPSIICDRMKSIKGAKKAEGRFKEAIDVLEENFTEMKYADAKEQVKIISIYLSALYLQVERLKQEYDLSSALTKNGCLTGFSKRNFTEKDFMGKLSVGGKAKVFGNPYIFKEKRKGEGEITSLLNKANGVLEINLNISEERAKDLEQKILDAGVSSFYLGKKGLAYVTKIDTRENS